MCRSGVFRGRIMHCNLRIMAKYNTLYREMILQLFTEHPAQTFSVNRLIIALRAAEDHKPGVSTVYRLIRKLTEEGLLIRTVQEGNREYVYQLAQEQEDAGFIILKCQRCGTSYRLQNEQTYSLLKTICEEQNFFIAREATFSGFCKHCKSSNR